MRGRASRTIGVARARRLVLAALLGATSLGAYAGDVARGDAAWSNRAEGERGERPLPDPILEAIGAYEAALAARPESLEARWKLLRALHFAGDFVLEDRGEQRRIFDRGRQVSEPGLELFGHAIDGFIVAPDLNIGILYIFAIASLGVYATVLAGWSSNNKYSLYGGIRASAQTISYELAMTISVVGVLMAAGSLHLQQIVPVIRSVPGAQGCTADFPGDQPCLVAERLSHCRNVVARADHAPRTHSLVPGPVQQSPTVSCAVGVNLGDGSHQVQEVLALVQHDVPNAAPGQEKPVQPFVVQAIRVVAEPDARVAAEQKRH